MQETPVSKNLQAYKKQLLQNIEQRADGLDINATRQQSNQESSIPQILRTCGKQFTQIRREYTDGLGEDVHWVLSCHIMVGTANA
jgi:hypothetical protein